MDLVLQWGGQAGNRQFRVELGLSVQMPELCECTMVRTTGAALLALRTEVAAESDGTQGQEGGEQETHERKDGQSGKEILPQGHGQWERPRATERVQGNRGRERTVVRYTGCFLAARHLLEFI